MTRTDPTPSTEAGRSLLRGKRVHTRVILAIEEQARAEGRQEAVREIRDVLADNHNTLGAEHYRLDQIEDVLDRVAGLNASESPPHGLTDEEAARWDRAVESGEAVARMRRLVEGDASESGQPSEASDE